MTEPTSLLDTFTAIAEQVRLCVATEYPQAKVTSIDFNTEIIYPMTYEDLNTNRIPSPVPGNITFDVRAFTILPDKLYLHKHVFTVAMTPDGLQIVGVDTRRGLA